MSAEKIIEQIKKDSEKEVKKILNEAEIKAKIIIESVKKEAEGEAEKILEEGKKQSDNLKKILISKTNKDIKTEIMNEKEKIIEDCFTKALHEISILKEKEYEKVVKYLIENGQKKLGKSSTILVSRDIDKKIAEELGIKVTGTIESSGGVILQSLDKLIILDHTFNGIIKREKNKIRIEVGKLLFS